MLDCDRRIASDRFQKTKPLLVWLQHGSMEHLEHATMLVAGDEWHRQIKLEALPGKQRAPLTMIDPVRTL